MDQTNIFDRVRPIISDKLAVEVEDVKPSASFVEDLGADSLDIIDLAMELEEAFGLTIPDQDYAELRTVGDAVNYIALRSAARA